MTQHTSLTEEQRRFWLQRGITIGSKRHAVIYAQCCEKHHARLVPTAPGHFECIFCQLADQIPATPAPEPQERHTDQLTPIPANRFLQWRLAQHQQAGPQTEVHRAVQWKKKS